MHITIGQYKQHLKAMGRKPSTIYQRTYWPRRLARELGKAPESWTSEIVEGWLAAQAWKPETRRAALKSLGLFIDYAGLELALPTAPRPSAPAPRPCPEPVYQAALAEAPTREALAIRLGGELGLRVSEVAGVSVWDLERDLFGWSLRIEGKGGRVRLVPLSESLHVALQAAAGPDGWVFPNGQGGHVKGNSLARRCRPYLSGWHFHSLRHRFASRAYQASGDIMATQRLLGHASPATTQRYVATDGATLRAVAAAAA